MTTIIKDASRAEIKEHTFNIELLNTRLIESNEIIIDQWREGSKFTIRTIKKGEKKEGYTCLVGMAKHHVFPDGCYNLRLLAMVKVKGKRINMFAYDTFE